MLIITCSGDEEPATTAPAQTASAPLKNEPLSPPQQLQQQQPQQTTDNVKVERATDPRLPPAPIAEVSDPDREFARNGGGQWQESHDSTPTRDMRPNPNKYEDG
jgi:hypothetical protein